MRPNWILLGVGGAIIAGLVFVLVGGFGRDPHEVPFMLTAQAAPSFSVERVEGGSVSLAELRGKPMLLNFWSTWCVPCKQEQPLLEWAAEKLSSKITFVGVVYEDTTPNVQEYLKNMPSHWLQTLDPQGRMAVDYGLSGVPETYFIDAAGTIRYKHIGPIDRDTLLKKLLLIAGPI